MSDITVKETYAFPREAVWEQLTRPELLSQWCIPTADFSLEKGKKFTLQTTPNKFWDGIFLCEVEDFTENAYLRYRCQNRRMKLDGVVEWTLTAAGGGTALELRHTGFEGVKGQFYRMLLTTGWKQMLAKQLPRELEAAGRQ